MACATTDMGIARKVRAQLAADSVVKASQIEVTVDQAIVTLTGNVDTEAAKTRALELAKNVQGVVRVVDMISARAHAVGEGSDDAGITMRVKGKLLEDPEVKALQIDVDTRNGVVFLTGSVRSNEERQKAIDLAMDAEGVRAVQTDLKD